MADLCAEPHPERPDITCDKPAPCYGYHANGEHREIAPWGIRPLPGKSSKPSKVQGIIDNATPEQHTGPPLATKAHARHTDPETSHQAAASLIDLRPSQVEVLGLFREHGPMIDETLLVVAGEARSRQTPSGLRTRRRELVDAGLLRDSGQRATTATGHQSILWCVPDE